MIVSMVQKLNFFHIAQTKFSLLDLLLFKWRVQFFFLCLFIFVHVPSLSTPNHATSIDGTEDIVNGNTSITLKQTQLCFCSLPHPKNHWQPHHFRSWGRFIDLKNEKTTNNTTMTPPLLLTMIPPLLPTIVPPLLLTRYLQRTTTTNKLIKKCTYINSQPPPNSSTFQHPN